jgi:hypothetical protein
MGLEKVDKDILPRTIGNPPAIMMIDALPRIVSLTKELFQRQKSPLATGCKAIKNSLNNRKRRYFIGFAA